jgi:predicted nucleic-acid-binding protein
LYSPFEANDLPVLPEDLSQALTEALQLRYGYELERKDIETLVSTDPVVEAMERRLREVVIKHQVMLLGLTATEEASRASFVDQIIAQIKSLSIKEVLSPVSNNAKASNHITLVSIDVNVESLHNELKSSCKA